MQVGQVLREARLKRGLDLYEVKRVTKISVPALRAMEEDRWEEVPAPGAEVLLETYAEFLELDAQSLLAERRVLEHHLVLAGGVGDQHRALALLDRLLGDDALLDVAAGGQLELDVV